MLLSQTEPHSVPTSRETTWLKVWLLVVFGILAAFVLPGLAPGGGALPASEISCATNGWCESDGFDEFITRALVAPNPKAAGIVSHVFTMGFCPLIALMSAISVIFIHRGDSNTDRGRGRLQSAVGTAVQDCLILLAIFLINIAITDFAKYTAKRERPCFYYNRQSETEAANSPNQQFVSFFSGDTSIAWVFSVGGVTLSKLRNYAHSSSSHPWSVKGVSPMIIAAVACASMGSFLRIVGYMHWTTDVIAGTLCGCAIGCLPRWLFPSSAATAAAGLSNELQTKTGIATAILLPASDSESESASGGGGGGHYRQLNDDKLAV